MARIRKEYKMTEKNVEYIEEVKEKNNLKYSSEALDLIIREHRQNSDITTEAMIKIIAKEVSEQIKFDMKEIKVIRLRPEKDDSDTQSAMNYAIRTGAKEIVIFGVTGNRVDHLMANFGLLILAQNQGAEVILVDQYNYMKLISDGTVLKKSEQFGKYVSFFPFGGNVTDLTLEGFKYPLSNYCLTAADSGLTVSNEIISEHARVTFSSGELLMIMSKD